MKKLLLCIFYSLSLGVFAQEATLNELNALLGPEMQLVESRKGYTFEFIKHGEPFRTDQFYVEDIDVAKIRYESTDNQVWIECYESAGKCFDRRIKRMKSRQPYPVLYFSVSDAVKADKIIQNLKQLLDKEDGRR